MPYFENNFKFLSINSPYFSLLKSNMLQAYLYTFRSFTLRKPLLLLITLSTSNVHQDVIFIALERILNTDYVVPAL